MRCGLKLSLSIQGDTGSGRTLSSLRLLQGARNILFPKGIIVYINIGEGNQIGFYKKHFQPLEIINIEQNFHPSDFLTIITNLSQRSDVAGIITDHWSALWERINELANKEGGFYAKKGQKGESAWNKYTRINNSITNIYSRIGNAWTIAILLDKRLTVSTVVDGQREPRYIGKVEVARWDTRSKFDLNFKTLPLSVRRIRDNQEELGDADLPLDYRQKQQEIITSAGYFKILKGKTDSFPLYKDAPLGFVSEVPMDESHGESLAKWLENLADENHTPGA